MLISLLAVVPLKANHSHQPYRDKRSGSMFYIVHCAILRPAHQRVLGAIAQQKMKTAMFRYNLSELVVWKSETHSTSPLPFQAHNMYTHTHNTHPHTHAPPPPSSPNTQSIVVWKAQYVLLFDVSFIIGFRLPRRCYRKKIICQARQRQVMSVL